jgi:hypothetical protein
MSVEIVTALNVSWFSIFTPLEVFRDVESAQIQTVAKKVACAQIHQIKQDHHCKVT